jgi:Transglycosylase SLT domain/SPOR domain
MSLHRINTCASRGSVTGSARSLLAFLMGLSLMITCEKQVFAEDSLAPAAEMPQVDRNDLRPNPTTEASQDTREPTRADPGNAPGSYQDSLCLMIESAARDHGLPVDFFARVIWRESRFKADAIGPVTRSGERAQGIAQFMPGTAAERRLLDPLDPVQALPKSAEFLQQLRIQFGNLGLAAAAYNAGPRRVQEWLEGTGPMPQETRNYVLAITGMSVEDWAAPQAKTRSSPDDKTGTGCGALMALLKRAPNPFVEQLQQRLKVAALAPWGVQLAAGFSRDAALATYSRTMRQFKAILGDRDPSIVSSVLRNRGTRAFYQVRVGANSRAVADALCGRIQGAGGACMVLRNKQAQVGGATPKVRASATPDNNPSRPPKPGPSQRKHSANVGQGGQ